MQHNLYTKDLRTAIFDIETTGLKAERDSIISASFCDEDGEGLRQYFCDYPQAEFLLLTKIIDELKALDCIITYNGRHFDLPFVLRRAEQYGLADQIPEIWNIDLYLWLKKYWKAAPLLPGLTQRDVEEAMGLQLHRTDTADGMDCIFLYHKYLLDGQAEYRKKIMLHNGDDVRQLARIAQNCSFLPFHQIVYEQGYTMIVRDDYPGAEDIPVRIRPVREMTGCFVADARTCPGMLPVYYFEDGFSLEYDPFSGLIRLEIRPGELEDYLYADLSAMPLDPADFRDLEGFASNYLILEQSGQVRYREFNRLAAELIRKVF